MCIVLSFILAVSITLHYDLEEFNKEIIERHSSVLTVEKAIIYDDFTIPIDDISQLLTGNFVGFVYFGRDTCPSCLEFNELLKNAISYLNGVEIHKFDTDYWRSHGDFRAILDMYGVSKVPMLVRIESSGIIEWFNIDINSFNILEKLVDFLCLSIQF